jgi:hypothetical protein
MRAYLDQRIIHAHYVSIYWTTNVLGFVRVFRKYYTSALVVVMRIIRGGGPEDQDVIERACDDGFTLVRSYDLLYFHMFHGTAEGWDDPALLATNREYFSKSRQARTGKPQATANK